MPNFRNQHFDSDKFKSFLDIFEQNDPWGAVKYIFNEKIYQFQSEMSENLEKTQKLLDVSFELRLARTAMRDFSNLNLKRGPVEPGNDF